MAQPDMTPMDACLITNRRPAVLSEYRKACQAAGDDEVAEIAAREVQPDMTIWHVDQWRTVKYRRATGQAVIIDYEMEEPATATRFASPSTPMYRRIGAEDQPRPVVDE